MYDQTKHKYQGDAGNLRQSHNRGALVFVGILFLVSTGMAGQDKKRELQVKPPPIYRQLEQPISPHYLKLFKAAFAKLNLVGTSSGNGEKNTKSIIEHFNSGNGISFLLVITNASEEDVFGWSVFNSHILNRPQLYRDGALVSYRDNIMDLLETIDRRFPNGRSSSYLLETRKSRTETIGLDDWYEPLQPGRYELSVWHRFLWGGEWLESPSVTFEVAGERLNKVKVQPSSMRN
ncbi:MAG TPA: hypothetical protein VNO50_20605 [Pyrinomonadaceae bacterium]|nr:hypothetical protein [Pyrinomonadaceae bacterium]